MNKQDTETFKELGLIIAIGFVLAAKEVIDIIKYFL